MLVVLAVPMLAIKPAAAAIAGIALTTDLIVGFPGETEDEFAETLALVEQVGFDDAYSFTYSPRPGTPAAELADTTGAQVKLARLHRLQFASAANA